VKDLSECVGKVLRGQVQSVGYRSWLLVFDDGTLCELIAEGDEDGATVDDRWSKLSNMELMDDYPLQELRLLGLITEDDERERLDVAAQQVDLEKEDRRKQYERLKAEFEQS
jgi:hypothetical protein